MRMIRVSSLMSIGTTPQSRTSLHVLCCGSLRLFEEELKNQYQIKRKAEMVHSETNSAYPVFCNLLFLKHFFQWLLDLGSNQGPTD